MNLEDMTHEECHAFVVTLENKMTDDEVMAYLKTLKVGERVIEVGQSCMTGKKGTVYISENEMTKGSICVRWDAWPGETSRMGTSATWGTRRISDITPA